MFPQERPFWTKMKGGLQKVLTVEGGKVERQHLAVPGEVKWAELTPPFREGSKCDLGL